MSAILEEAALAGGLLALLLAALVTCSLLAIGVIGYGNGLGGERAAPLTMPLAVLIGSALWITIDLDHPRAGMIRLSDAPLRALKFERPSD